MDDTVAGLVGSLLTRLEKVEGDRRVLVGLCGIPGSGKSQLARHVAAQLNEKAGSDIAIVIGMDGWHLTRAQLEAMPDPQLAKDRRGAAWTFDDKVGGSWIIVRPVTILILTLTYRPLLNLSLSFAQHRPIVTCELPHSHTPRKTR
jgi:energy-coupling factor transporter ATP-binding protein EcfA2